MVHRSGVDAKIGIEVRELQKRCGVHRDQVRHAVVEAQWLRRVEVHHHVLLADVVGDAELVAVPVTYDSVARKGVSWLLFRVGCGRRMVGNPRA